MNEKVENVFDCYCKKILRNAAVDFQRKKQHKCKNEISLEALNNLSVEALRVHPTYELECKKYRINNCDINVTDEKLINVFELLSDEQTAIILLYYFLDMTDDKIAKSLRQSRRTINYKRLKVLSTMKTMLEGVSDDLE